MTPDAPDITEWAPILLHDVDAFAKEGIEERAKALSAPVDRVEVFAWLLEIAAQAAEAAEQTDGAGRGVLILRGGTSTQLRVGEGRQRGSADVDALFRGSVDGITRLIEAMNARLAPCAPFLQFTEFVRTERAIPKFKAWECFIPRFTGSPAFGHEEDPGRQVLLEIHAIEDDEPPPFAQLAGTGFGVVLSSDRVDALTAGALMGDKLDCLSPPSPIGIDAEKYDKHARHIYDLTMLLDTTPVDAKVLKDASKTVVYFTRRDAELRDYEPISPEDTMRNAERFLTTWGWPKQPASTPTTDQLDRARSFEQNVPAAQRAGAPQWAMRALRAGLLARAVRETIEASADEAAARHQRRMRLVDEPDEETALELADRLVAVLDASEDLSPAEKKQLRNNLVPRNAPPAAHQKVVALALLIRGDQEFGF